MLKLARIEEERRGAALMEWWAGEGAAPVLRREGSVLLMERTESGDLCGMADDRATNVICDVAARLHARRNKAAPELAPLAQWFGALAPAAVKHGGLLAECAGVARELLAAQDQAIPLHGDIHHGNVLDFGDVTARDVMVPRTQTTAFAVVTPVADVLKQVADAAHSRYPVYRDTVDNVIGVLHAKDLLRAVARSETLELEPILRPVA